jgi:hypothetical protein
MKIKQILSEEFKRMQKLAGVLNEVSKKEIWVGELIPIPSELSDELMQYSNSEEKINNRFGDKRLDGRYSDKFLEIDFDTKEIYYIASLGPSEYGREDFSNIESFNFGKENTAYKGEIESILNNLIKKIKEKGIQPNN